MLYFVGLLQAKTIRKMARQKKEIQYSEADLVVTFSLNRQKAPYTQLMSEWTNAEVLFTENDLLMVDNLWQRAFEEIEGWQEEDLKIKFLAPMLELAGLVYHKKFKTYFEKTVSATIEGHFLKTKVDFMISKGFMERHEQPYFHFQEWKPLKKPTGDSMVQLLEAMLIAQELNKDKLPIYGCEVVGRQWNFVILEGKTYCVSKMYESTDKASLLKILAMLRKLQSILTK
jgi:hypothetical protein